MVEHRTRMKIIGEILTTTKDGVGNKNGATVTYLISKVNISHPRISKLLSNLVSQGLLEQVSSQKTCRYKISFTGKKFLKVYQEFGKLAENFGMEI